MLSSGTRDSEPGRYTLWLGYGLAVGLTGATLVPLLMLRSWIGPPPLLVAFLIPIILSAYVGGFGTGLFATILVALTSAWLMIPFDSLRLEQPVDLVHWVMLWVTGILASALTARARGVSGGVEPEVGALALIESRIRWGFVLALVCLGVVGTVSFQSVVRLNKAAVRVAHSHEVLRSLDAVREAVSVAEARARAYIISGDTNHIEPYEKVVRSLDERLLHVRVLMGDDAEQQQRLDALAPLITARLQALNKVIALRRESGFDTARAELMTGPGGALHDGVGRLVGEIIATEGSQLTQRERAAARRSNTARAVIVFGGMIAFAVVAAALFGVRRDFALHRLGERVMRAAKGDLEARVSERTAELEQSARNLAAEVVVRSGAQQRLQAQFQCLSLLQHITRGIAERQNLPSIFSGVLGTLEEHLPVDFCCVGLRDVVHTHLTITSIGTRGLGFANALGLTTHARVEIDENGLGRCMLGHVVYEPDAGEVTFPFAQSLAQVGLGSVAIAPLQVESAIFGALICARRQRNSFSSEECEFIRQVSEHVALAAHQAQLYDAIRAAYEDLRVTQRAVLQQERLRALGQMASGIAHDINNAISPVMLYVESLLDDLPDIDPDARRRLLTVQRAVIDVGHTVSRLREFSHERESQLELLPVDLTDLAREVASLTHARWSDMAQGRGVSIMMRLDLAPDLPVIMGVASELRDALVNLIFNAVDAMPDGGPLTVRTRVVEQPAAPGHVPARQVSLEVSDCGIGMDEDTRRRCMEPFFTTKGERGTGLGLAMVYGTMQRHGSEVQIDSTPGMGTTVRCHFPIAGASPVEVAAPVPIEVSPLHILLVDDDLLVARAVRETLAKDGHRVSCAEGGQAGIDMFEVARQQGDPFDVVMSDLGMPHVDGHAVCRSVKTVAPGTTVILLTGWGQKLLAAGGTPSNVDCVLAKPPTRRDLRVALAYCLAMRKIA